MLTSRLFVAFVSLTAVAVLLYSTALTAEPPEEGTVKSADGVEVAYDVRGKGDTALVFIHGWSGDREYWKHQVEPLAADYRVVTLDLPGHGRSGRDRKLWTATGFAADVEAVVKKLELKRVILIGHSMGGPVSLATAKRLPGIVIGIVAVDTLQNAEYKFPEEQRQQYLAAFAKDFTATMAFGLAGMLPEKVDPELTAWLLAKSLKADRTMANAVMRDLGTLDQAALLKEAKVPVRAINAAGGFMFHVPTAVETQQKYADYKAVLVDGVGHFPMLEKPDEFNAKLREVLKELATAR